MYQTCYVAQDDLSFWSSCPHLPSVQTMDRCHCIQLPNFLKLGLGAESSEGLETVRSSEVQENPRHVSEWRRGTVGSSHVDTRNPTQLLCKIYFSSPIWGVLLFERGSHVAQGGFKLLATQGWPWIPNPPHGLWSWVMGINHHAQATHWKRPFSFCPLSCISTPLKSVNTDAAVLFWTRIPLTCPI